MKAIFRTTALVLAAWLGSETSPVSGQNLVLNPGFEDSLKCPSGSGAYTGFVSVWTKPSYASSDYFYDGCPVAPVNEPPHGGHAYAGIIVYDPANYREYITGTLSSPLLAGNTYEISFYVSLLDNCLNGISEVGAWFTPALPSFSNANPILLTPTFQNNKPLAMDSGWQQVKGFFQAAGGEQYVTIGAFVPDTQMTFTPAPGTNSWYDVYYFIDDVRVARDSATGIAVTGYPVSVDVFPSPADDRVEIRVGAKSDVVFLDAFGRVLWTGAVHDRLVLDTSRWPAGVVGYSVRNRGVMRQSGRLMVIHRP